MRLDILTGRSQAYQQTFSSPHAKKVLADLRRYCMADKPTFMPGDPYATAFGEGRRDVWNRIMKHINLTESEISKLKE